MSLERTPGLHEFRVLYQQPFGWNGIYGTVVLLDKVGFPPPIELEVGGRGSGLVNVCLTPVEAGKLSVFLDDYKYTVAASAAAVEGRRGRDPSEAADQAVQFLDDAVLWFAQAFRSDNYVTVVPVPTGRSKV